jgi:hypothetical protein
VRNVSRRMDAGAVWMERRNKFIYIDHNKSSLLPVKPKTRRNIYIVCLIAHLNRYELFGSCDMYTTV